MLASPALSQDPSPIKLPSTLRPKTSVKALKQPKKRFETVRTKALEKAKKRAADKKKKAAPAKKPASKPFKKMPAPKIAKPAKKTERHLRPKRSNLKTRKYRAGAKSMKRTTRTKRHQR